MLIMRPPVLGRHPMRTLLIMLICIPCGTLCSGRPLKDPMTLPVSMPHGRQFPPTSGAPVVAPEQLRRLTALCMTVLYSLHSPPVEFPLILHGCMWQRYPTSKLFRTSVPTVWRSRGRAVPKLGPLLRFRAETVTIGTRGQLVLIKVPWTRLKQPAVWYTLLARATVSVIRLGLHPFLRTVLTSRLMITTVGQ